jgi:inhibitor of KinA sporulation pathway (predicted exonuclease)
VRHLESECERAGLDFPAELERRHLNLKVEFASRRRTRPMGMADALRALGLSLDGEHHRALDDARNIAAIARTILFPRDIAP